MRLGTALMAALLLLPALAHAQAPSLKGRFVDPTNQAAVAGVKVKLTNLADTAEVRQLTAADDGRFEATGLGAHDYRLEASRLGYAVLRLVIPVSRPGQDVGVLQMTPEAVHIAGVTVTESPAPAIQKGDTTEFRASAVKTGRDATAEDLVQKLPGVTVENGQVKAQGETVQQVLVNGKPFFGTDPTTGMRNLPAEVVDRIQLYDKGSDQAEFSGFDDGPKLKTMNFILRDLKGRFGKIYGGYGDRERYQGGGNATWLKGGSRLTLIGISNNINQRNFSPQDLLGAISGSGGGRLSNDPTVAKQLKKMLGGFDPSSFLVSPQGGVSTTHSGGANYVGQWGPRLSASASLFANDIDNENEQSVAREYVPPQDSLAFYSQNTGMNSRNGNQRFDGRLQWFADSTTLVTVKPRFYAQNNRGSYLGLATNTTPFGSLLNTSSSDTRTHADGNTINTDIGVQHRFAKKGRSMSIELETERAQRDGERHQLSFDQFTQGGTSRADTLDQRTTSNSVTNSVVPQVEFTETLAKNLQVQLGYEPQYLRTRSDVRSRRPGASGTYSEIDTLQSSTFTNWTRIHTGSVALQFMKGIWRWQTKGEWQRTQLKSEEAFPGAGRVDHSFVDILPSTKLYVAFNKRLNLKLGWSTASSAPSTVQLQNVVDNSNPLSLTAGNPNLRQSYTNNFSLKLSQADALNARSMYLFMNIAHTQNTISNSTFTAATPDTVDGIVLAPGTQLTRPVNLGVSWNGSAFFVYSRPVKFLSSIASVNGGGSFSRTPTQLNAAIVTGRSYAVRFGAVLASNISQNFDFTLSYQANYNANRNTFSTRVNGDYYAHTLGLRLGAVGRYGIVVRQEVSHNLQSGLAARYGQNVLLWNTTLGKKFLKDDSGEFRLTATDVLQQDSSVGRSFTESYIQDSRDRTLGRFVQAVFTYSFK